jgi:hypothetical protein
MSDFQGPDKAAATHALNASQAGTTPSHRKSKPRPAPHFDGNAIVAAPVTVDGQAGTRDGAEKRTLGSGVRLVNFGRDHVHMGAVEVGKRTTDDLAITNTTSADADAVADVTVEIQGVDKGQFCLSPNQKLGFDGQRAELQSGRAGEIRIAATPNHVGTNTAALLWHVHSRRPDLGPDYSVRTELAVNAREPGYEAKDAAQVAGMVEVHEQANAKELEILTQEKAELNKDGIVELASLFTDVHTIGENRQAGLKNLQRDMTTNDSPSWPKQLAMKLIENSITSGSKALAKIVSSYLTGPAAALVPVAVDYLAVYVSQEIMAHMHIDEAADVGLAEFFIMQGDACAAAAKTYTKTFRALAKRALVTPDASTAIIALQAAADQMSERAADEQYMAGLKAWSQLQAGGNVYSSAQVSSQDPSPITMRRGKFVVKLAQFDELDSPIRIVGGLWGGVTGQVNKSLKVGFSRGPGGGGKSTDVGQQKSIADIEPILRVEFTALDEFGTERDHAFEKFPDDAHPVYGSTTRAWISRRNQTTSKDFESELLTLVNKQSLSNVIKGDAQ